MLSLAKKVNTRVFRIIWIYRKFTLQLHYILASGIKYHLFPHFLHFPHYFCIRGSHFNPVVLYSFSKFTSKSNWVTFSTLRCSSWIYHNFHVSHALITKKCHGRDNQHRDKSDGTRRKWKSKSARNSNKLQQFVRICNAASK